eukprot:CCRYP_017461-RA/>CCRYP_017461-RA protein AED:0.00 eAED:0.00 QI:61/1/1/1/0/0/2/54/35
MVGHEADKFRLNSVLGRRGLCSNHLVFHQKVPHIL